MTEDLDDLDIRDDAHFEVEPVAETVESEAELVLRRGPPPPAGAPSGGRRQPELSAGAGIPPMKVATPCRLLCKVQSSLVAALRMHTHKFRRL